MGRRLRWSIGTALGVGVLGILSACQTQHPSREIGSGGVVRAAEVTYAAYGRAIRAQKEQPSTEIPERYWADGIKALKPIRVYEHRVNVVVVQRESKNLEEGKYIYIPVSSYLPMSGDDGFTFEPNPKTGNIYDLGTGVFNYKRTKEN